MNIKWELFKERVRLLIFGKRRNVVITLKCPLWADKDKRGCEKYMRIQVLSPDGVFDFDQLLDMVFNSIGRHLTADHNIRNFQGLEFRTQYGKYTFFGSYHAEGQDNEKV